MSNEIEKEPLTGDPLSGIEGTASVEALDKGAAASRIDNAANVLAMIKDEAGHDGVDREVAKLVVDAQGSLRKGSVLSDAIAAEEVGMLETLQGGRETAEVINESPQEVFDPAVHDLFMVGGEDVVIGLEERLRAVEDEHSDKFAPENHEHGDEVIKETDSLIYANGLDGKVQIVSPKLPVRERAKLLVEKMGGDVSPDVLYQIEQRMKREPGEAPLLGPKYTQKILDATGDDYELKLKQIAEFAHRDAAGQEVLSFDATEVLLKNIHKEAIDKKKQEGVGAELCYLAGIQAEASVDFRNPKNIQAHCSALRILEAASGKLPISWLKALHEGAGGDLPEEAKRYAAKPEFIQLAFEDVADRFDSKKSFLACFSEVGGTISERKKNQRELMETIDGALDALMEGTDESYRLLQMFKFGDLYGYGFDRGQDKTTGEKMSVLNEKGWNSITQYIINATALGRDRLVALRKELGIVNFGTYKEDALRAQEDILQNPQNHKNIYLYVRGRDGDHNHASSDIGQRVDFKNTLISEIGDEKDLEYLDQKIESLGVSVDKLTLFGHGGEKGIAVSNNFFMKRDTEALAKMTGLHRLINRISPDRFGNKSVVLASCSQGVRYDSHGSMAEILSRVADNKITVEAAPGIMYSLPGRDRTDILVVTHPYYEVVKLLKKYDRYPGVKRLIKRLDDHDRLRIGSLQVSREGTLKNRSGNVRIGA